MQAGDGRPSYDELAALVVEQARVIAELLAEDERLRAENGRLSARVAELERRLNRHSGNSSLLPSAAAFIRPEKKPTPRSGRRRGGRPGSAGGGLAMVETPDRVDDHLSQGCGGCGAGLILADGAGYERRQVWDIPLIRVTATEHRAHRCRCRCGMTTRAAMPVTAAGSPTSYGLHLCALAAYLLDFQHIPVERTARLIGDLTCANVSTGWASGALGQAAGPVADSLKLIRALLTLGHVLHADETTTRIGGGQRWLHVACTERLTLLGLGPRSREGANTLGVLPDFRGDSLALYVGYPDARHQLCGAHLARELTGAAEDHPQQRWPVQVRWALPQLNEQAKKAAAQHFTDIPPKRALVHWESFHHGVAVGLSLHPRAPGRNLLERGLNALDAIRRAFTGHLWMPPIALTD
ncbi:transposase [Nonomuraea sp. NPDC049269]|uniref:IS66 family transposase n=1 Tax=Nonomuraea sp. NPDC049269 TaxID=3364349 RepID=UPI00371DDEB9